MTKRAVIVTATIIIVTAALITLYFVDPLKAEWAPKCMIHSMTGLQCPGCGISRATHALLHGKAYEALQYNWFFIISIPYFLAVLFSTIFSDKIIKPKFKNIILGRKTAITYVILFAIWFIIRNIFKI